MTLVKLLAAGSLALGIAASAVAQPAPEPSPERGFGGQQPHRMGMHRMGKHRMGMAMRGLDLTEAQRDQIFKIRHEQAPALRERMKAARGAHEELRALSVAPRFDAARARVAAETAAKAMADLAFMRAETRSRIREILTDEQRGKLDKMRSQRGRR